MIDEDVLIAKRRQEKAAKNAWTHESPPLSAPDTVRRAKLRPNEKFQKSKSLAEGGGEAVNVDKKIVKPTGRLAEQLLQQGIVTKKMMKQLKRELEDQEDK